MLQTTDNNYQGTTVNAAVKQISVWEQKYYDITELYALNDELLATVPNAADPEAQMALVAPLIETIGESADLLTEEYIALCEHGAAHGKTAKSKIETGLRKVYNALQEFSHRAADDTRNTAHFVVKKIKRQLEQVITNFVEFVALSLSRIMQKNDVEELNAHHASIALMLHAAQTPGVK